MHFSPSRLLVAFTLGAITLLPALAQQPAPKSPYAGPGFTPLARSNANSIMGINLNGPADWNGELPFVDVFRLSREWISQQQGKPWGQGPKLDVDTQGWIKKLEAGAFAESPLMTVERIPQGIYTVLYEGEGKLDFWPADKVKVVATEKGRLLLDVRGGIFLRVVETKAENPIRNIRVIMPGYENTYKENPFRPGFLQTWQGMNTFRFMDWMHTNGNQTVKWEERPQVDDITYTHGIPVEVMVDLSNRQQTNPWFCMPAHCDDDYVRQFATLVRDTLDPTLHVYIEYSNEVWNGGFEQTGYAQKKAQELGIGPKERPWEGGGMYYAQRSMEIFKIWEEVFDGKERLVRVLAWQAGNAWWAENIILPYKEAFKHADALAIAPYVTMCIGPNSKPSSNEVQNWPVDQVLDYAEKTALRESAGWMKEHKRICDKFGGLRLIAYEGGQHLVGVGGGENNEKMTALFIAANRNPRMGEIYRKYYDAWKSNAGGDLFCTFSSVGGFSKWGSWGLAENYDDALANSPKLKATLEWAATHPLENAAPVIEAIAPLTVKVDKPLKLAAKITDDSKTKMAVIASWSCDQPANVSFANACAAETEVTFTKTGAYFLLLRASDGFARAERTVAVTVTE